MICGKASKIKIHTIPWICEKGVKLSNTAHNKQKQIDIFSKNHKKDSSNINPRKNIDWSYMYDKTSTGTDIKSSRSTASYDNFVKFVAKTFVNNPKTRGKKHIKIAVFSHSRFLRENVPNWRNKYRNKDKRVSNNQVIKQDYHYDEEHCTLDPIISRTLCPNDICTGFRGYNYRSGKSLKKGDARCYESTPNVLKKYFKE